MRKTYNFIPSDFEGRYESNDCAIGRLAKREGIFAYPAVSIDSLWGTTGAIIAPKDAVKIKNVTLNSRVIQQEGLGPLAFNSMKGGFETATVDLVFPD